MEKIRVVTTGYDFNDVAQELGKALQEIGLEMEVVSSPIRSDEFSLSPEIATIIVSGMSVLSALINALLVFISTRKAGTIVIVGASGRKIEIPRDTPKEKIDDYLDLAMKIDTIQHIEVNSR